MRTISDVVHTDAVIVGSGIAGLTAALTLGGDCTVISKTGLGDGSSRLAQGGIAAAVVADDDPALHARDTVAVSAGLADPTIAALVCGAAPDRIRWLVSQGTRFETGENGSPDLGREAGHGRARILHSDGDRTGAEVMRALVAATHDHPNIERLDGTFVVDLIVDADRVVGVLALTAAYELIAIMAPSVVLATGGIGRLYAYTTNPPEVTGDGLAMAARAGAEIRDPEFVQFHPTALDVDLDPLPLLTEALRGEGAHLVDVEGRRYMQDVHPDAELAPRDVVALENWRQMQRGRIYLDATVVGPDFPERFPTVWTYAQQAGIDPRVTPLPVSPAQHYHMGGVRTDDRGRTSLTGLYACGETSSTGLHGANRLASNSLLEGVVFGTRVADAIRDSRGARTMPASPCVPATALRIGTDDDRDSIDRLRRVMWDQVGIVREEHGLRRARVEVTRLTARLDRGPVGRNLVATAHLVIAGALARRESRGGHRRSDHPRPRRRASHTVMRTDAERRVELPLRRIHGLAR